MTRSEIAVERRRAALEPAGQAPPPRLLASAVSPRRPIDRLVDCLACGARDSRFAKVGKHDPGRDGVAAPLSRWADAGDRQAGRNGRASRPAEQQGPEQGMPGGPFRRAALRPAAPAGAGAPARPRHLRMPRARPPSQSAGAARQAVQATARSTRPTGPSSKAARMPTKAKSTLPLGRLDAKRGWWMKHDPQGQPAVTKWKVMGRSPPGADLARARTPDRTHAPASRALRGDGLAYSGRCDLRHGAATGRPAAASACPRNHCAALQEPRADPRHRRAGAGAYARAAGGSCGIPGPERARSDP